MQTLFAPIKKSQIIHPLRFWLAVYLCCTCMMHVNHRPNIDYCLIQFVLPKPAPNLWVSIFAKCIIASRISTLIILGEPSRTSWICILEALGHRFNLIDDWVWRRENLHTLAHKHTLTRTRTPGSYYLARAHYWDFSGSSSEILAAANRTTTSLTSMYTNEVRSKPSLWEEPHWS